MKVLIGDKGNVDFDDPIPMNKEQQQKFLVFMNEMFHPITIEEDVVFRINRLGDQIFLRKWDDKEEYAVLLDITMDTNEVCTKLGRTWMSVNMKRGMIIPDLMRWADSKGIDLIKGDIRDIIEVYLEEKKEISRLNRKMAWDKKKRAKKEIDSIRNEIGRCKTMIHTLERRINTNLEFPSDPATISLNKEKIKNLELEYYTKIIEMDPDDDSTWNNKGDALCNLDRYDEAIECYDKSIEINPNYDLYWNNKGNALCNLEKYDEAIEFYDKALEINSFYDLYWNNKGNAAYNLERYDEAIGCYDKALEIDPDDDSTWNNKGDALYNLEKYDEAVGCYDKALKINSDDDSYWVSKGDALYSLERYDEAIECYDKALEINSNNDVAWYTSASIFSKNGNKEEALYRLAKSIELDGSDKNSAMNDQDFELLWDDSRFKELIK